MNEPPLSQKPLSGIVIICTYVAPFVTKDPDNVLELNAPVIPVFTIVQYKVDPVGTDAIGVFQVIETVPPLAIVVAVCEAHVAP